MAVKSSRAVFEVLREISTADGASGAAEIARMLKLPLTTAARALNTLEAAGYVRAPQRLGKVRRRKIGSAPCLRFHGAVSDPRSRAALSATADAAVGPQFLAVRSAWMVRGPDRADHRHELDRERGADRRDATADLGRAIAGDACAASRTPNSRARAEASGAPRSCANSASASACRATPIRSVRWRAAATIWLSLCSDPSRSVLAVRRARGVDRQRGDMSARRSIRRARSSRRCRIVAPGRGALIPHYEHVDPDDIRLG